MSLHDILANHWANMAKIDAAAREATMAKSLDFSAAVARPDSPLIAVAPATKPGDGLTLPCRLVEVHDGDTVKVSVGAIALSIRLLDCWAPELDEPGGVESRENLKALVSSGQPLSVFFPLPEAHADGKVYLADLFTLGRILGRIFVGDLDVSPAQVAAGHATATKPKAVK